MQMHERARKTRVQACETHANTYKTPKHMLNTRVHMEGDDAGAWVIVYDHDVAVKNSAVY